MQLIHQLLRYAYKLGVAIKMIGRSYIYAFFRLATLLVFLMTGGCGENSNEPSTADGALEKLQKKYDEFAQKQIEDPVKWAVDDLENIGDWDYHVQELSIASAPDFEAQLNNFGDERWEVIWMEITDDGFLVVMKRPSVSYLSKVPLSQIGRIVIGGSETEE